jgi:hypothetical protein
MCKASKLRTCGRELESQAPDPSPELRLFCARHTTHFLTILEEDERGHALDVMCFRRLSVVIHINLQV